MAHLTLLPDTLHLVTQPTFPQILQNFHLNRNNFDLNFINFVVNHSIHTPCQGIIRHYGIMRTTGWTLVFYFFGAVSA